MLSFIRYSRPFLVALCMILSISFLNAQEKDPILVQFGPQYQTAVDYIKINKKAFQEIDSSKRAIISSMAFPELMRYSLFKNMLETKWLYLHYINGGKEAADFSIGPLQMRPSFAEKVEAYIQEDSSFSSHQVLLKYDNCERVEDIRAQRLKRLEELSWQLKYLCATEAIIYKNYPHTHQLNTEAYISFLATAYNRGIGYPKEEYDKWQKIISFPFGYRYPKEGQFIYHEIALFFFDRDRNILF